MTDDFRRLRIRHDAHRGPDRSGAPGGSPAFVGQVTSTGTNLGVGKFAKVTPRALTGAESEGGAGLLTSLGGSVLVYMLGPSAPSTGDDLICRWVDYRWVAERMTSKGGDSGSSGGGTVPFCICTGIPETLTMHSCSTTCNFSMFQNCTISYIPTPAWAAPLSLGPNVFFSTASFPDPLSTPPNAPFVYWLSCIGNQFNLQRIYMSTDCTGAPGGPCVESIVIYSWSTSLPSTGSYCAPGVLVLGLGNPFPGSDLTCCVTIFGGGPSPACVTSFGTIC